MPQQKVGDICEVCRAFWENQSEEPRVLQRLGSTKNHKSVVPACSHCDGNALGIKPKRKKKG